MTGQLMILMTNPPNSTSSPCTLVSGARATGSLHLGHLLGVLSNWTELQTRPDYRCFFFIADWHALTTAYGDTGSLRADVLSVATDFLAAGVDPERATVFVQSAVPEIAELHLLLSMFTPNNWAERDPTLKDLVRSAENRQPNRAELTYGMLGYPILQTADILAFRGSVVPVGRDQAAHLELSRDISRRFNQVAGIEFFPEPKPVFAEQAALPGIDGRKMSKSLGNDLKLAADPTETTKLIKKMITDPERQRRDQAGATDRCQVPWPFWQIFAASAAEQAAVKSECESAQRGCVDCKLALAERVNEQLATLRERRQALTSETVQQILAAGALKARTEAHQTLAAVKELLKLP